MCGGRLVAEKNVERVAAPAPGGRNDKTARTVELVMPTMKHGPATLAVVNN